MKTLLQAFFAAMFSAGVAVAQDVGPIPETFKATYLAVADADGPSCASLLVTGQFLAPTPGYTVSLKPADDQVSAPAVYALEMISEPPSGMVNQVLTATPVIYEDAEFDECPYGIRIDHEGSAFIVGVMPQE